MTSISEIAATQQVFDFDALEAADKKSLEAATRKIHKLQKKGLRYFVEEGQILREQRERLAEYDDDRTFKAWCSKELEFSKQSAENRINAADFCDAYGLTNQDVEKLAIDITALYDIARLPEGDTLAAECLERAKSGEHVRAVHVRQALAERRALAKQSDPEESPESSAQPDSDAPGTQSLIGADGEELAVSGHEEAEAVVSAALEDGQPVAAFPHQVARAVDAAYQLTTATQYTADDLEDLSSAALQALADALAVAAERCDELLPKVQNAVLECQLAAESEADAEAGAEADEEIDAPVKNCAQCGEIFEPANSRVKKCDECKKANRRERDRARRAGDSESSVGSDADAIKAAFAAAV